MDDFWDWYIDQTSRMAQHGWDEEHFWGVVDALHNETEWNYGSCTMNVLWAIAPDVALDAEHVFPEVDRERQREGVQPLREFVFGG